MLEKGLAPILDDVGGASWQIDLTPVDICAMIVHRLSLSGTTGIRYMNNKNTISFDAIWSRLGRHIRRIPYKDWLQIVMQSPHLAPLSSIFHEPVSKDCRSTFEALLQMDVFRNSSYEATLPEDVHDRLPATAKLLDEYLRWNEGVFGHIAEETSSTDTET